ncbi:putative polyadenylate-binding protein-interacting protein/7, CUE [Helianthus annuus]|nr:putative polyadenylate-binding protein-interacting protein/7, CUE [Helianthus annuus]
MSLLNGGASTIDKTLNTTTGKAKSLNPDAAEFVPFALRSSSGNPTAADTSSSFGSFAASSPGKSILNRIESSVSNNSDDETRQFWRDQLPDDIIPDFNVVGEEESQTINSFHHPLLTGIIDEPHYNGDPGHGYLDDLFNEQQMEGTDVNSFEFLASQFPGFAAESLAEVYYANGCDLNLTIEMLTQLELQVDNGLNPNLNARALSAPNLSALDFPTLSPTDNPNNVPTFSVNDHHPNHPSLEKELLMFKSSSMAPSLGATDFASAVKKMASHDSSIWKYDNNNHSPNSTVGSSRSSHNLSSGFGRSAYGDRFGNRSSSRISGTAPVWLETGEAVANMYSEMRGEARDHARLRNSYFEQARQAYLVGQKALAKELSAKGQLHNMQMKAAHEKAQESIYYQRNPGSLDIQGNGRGQERIIDLHGLHVNEAIHVLKRDLMTLRNIARSTDQRLQAYICVGTGHHTKGTRTPARLPVAVQRYLLEVEGLDYSEPQPGLLRVVLY